MAEGCQKPRDYPAGCPGWMHLLVGAIQWQLGGLQRWFGEELEYFSPNVQEPWRDPSLAFPSPGQQSLVCTGGISTPRERPVMGQQAGNSLYQTKMNICSLNQRLPVTGQDTQLSETPPNSVQNKKNKLLECSCPAQSAEMANRASQGCPDPLGKGSQKEPV